MGVAKWIVIGGVTLMVTISVASLVKKRAQSKAAAPLPAQAQQVLSVPASAASALPEPRVPQKGTPLVPCRPTVVAKDDFPHIDRIFQLFSTTGTKLPIVETVSYTSSVPWLKGRPAWLADYAVYYGTSRHFIARSLNAKADYTTQKVADNCLFNVFRKDKKFEFHLLVDLSRCKMGFYYVDLDTGERVLLKTYAVGVGKGGSTPVGKYRLGSRVAIYDASSQGFHMGKQIEMVRLFGSRWMPLEAVGEGNTSKGYGIHGAPWVQDPKTNGWMENGSVVGAYEGDGSIRLSGADMEELFAIVLTKPTWVEIVKDFKTATLPGLEVATPSR